MFDVLGEHWDFQNLLGGSTVQSGIRNIPQTEARETLKFLALTAGVLSLKSRREGKKNQGLCFSFVQGS